MNSAPPLTKQHHYDCIVYLLLEKGFSQSWVDNVCEFLNYQTRTAVVLFGKQPLIESFESQSTIDSNTVVQRDSQHLDFGEVLRTHLSLTTQLDLLVIRSEVYMSRFAIETLLSAQPRQLATISTLSNHCALFKLYGDHQQALSLTNSNYLLRHVTDLDYFETPFFYANFVYCRYHAIASLVEQNLLSSNPMHIAQSLYELGYLHAALTHCYIEDRSRSAKTIAKKIDRHPSSQAIITRHPLTATRFKLAQFAKSIEKTEASQENAKPKILHVMHSWGGGLHRWVCDYIDADEVGENLVLKSIGDWGAFGKRLSLYKHPNDAEAIRYWELYHPIHGTVVSHLQYADILETIVKEYGVDQIIISSLIGHSLDIAKTGLPTAAVIHDYYPFCPAIYTYFDGICTSCSKEQLEHCENKNPLNYFFKGVTTQHWLTVRDHYVDCIQRYRITLITPSRAAEHQLKQVATGLQNTHFYCIPHGLSNPPAPHQIASANRGERLKVLVLGRLDTQKGLELYKTITPQIAKFADVVFLGCGDEGRRFAQYDGVVVEESYAYSELSCKLAEYATDVGLLLSVCPETYSYTLNELMAHGITPLANAHGAALDRIQPGVTGFLLKPSAGAIIEQLKDLSDKPQQLVSIKTKLLEEDVRTTGDMVADYQNCFYNTSDVGIVLAAHHLEISPPTENHSVARSSITGDKDFFQLMRELEAHLLNMINKVPGIHAVLRRILSAAVSVWIHIPVRFAAWFLARIKGN